MGAGQERDRSGGLKEKKAVFIEAREERRDKVSIQIYMFKLQSLQIYVSSQALF